METQLEAQNIVPQELGDVRGEQIAFLRSFTKALEILKSNETGKRGIELLGPFKLTRKERKSLKLLPEAFRLNKTMQKLKFYKVEVDDILISEALRAGLRKR